MLTMSGRLSRQPRYNRVMDHQQPNRKKFYVIVTGACDRAYEGLLKKLKNVNQIEVNDRDACDYYLVFCPIASRVGTDIGEAESRIPDDKPVILVVMHHTHDSDYVIVDSSIHTTKPNIQLSVDCLFFTGKLLKSNHNDMAWHKIKKFLGVIETTPWMKRVFSWRCMFAVSCTITAAALITMVYLALKKS